ncbi:MAG: hypothetical protein ABI775_10605 [Pseudonocardiales bacterium]|nr:hypothetical protein [Actinomycetota bacterium]
MILLIVLAAVIVVLLVLLRIADRHDRRRGHQPRRMADIRSATRTQRQDLRTTRRSNFLPTPRALRDEPGRPRMAKKQPND